MRDIVCTPYHPLQCRSPSLPLLRRALSNPTTYSRALQSHTRAFPAPACRGKVGSKARTNRSNGHCAHGSAHLVVVRVQWDRWIAVSCELGLKRFGRKTQKETQHIFNNNSGARCQAALKDVGDGIAARLLELRCHGGRSGSHRRPPVDHQTTSRRCFPTKNSKTKIKIPDV
jgi:hypothetical protein